MRVVIQVKKWQAPVSLSAVQEVAAGAAMYKAGVAAVVSVSGYQPSAVRLAQANRVLLLSYEDLFDFTRRVPSVLR
jgi:HJR/Mrr/RecB family endonuclease